MRVMNAPPARTTTPTTGCTPTDLAAYAPGQTFTDPATGVRIDVLAGGRMGDTVRMSRR